jgi:hypothetical protein
MKIKIKTDAAVREIKQRIKQWDVDFEQFQMGAYPRRLLAQVEYRERIGALTATRLLVEERLVSFKGK